MGISPIYNSKMQGFLEYLRRVLAEEDSLSSVLDMIDDKQSSPFISSDELAKLRNISGMLPTQGVEIVKVTKEKLFGNPYLRDIHFPQEIYRNGFQIGTKRPIRTGVASPYVVPIRDPRTLRLVRKCFVLSDNDVNEIFLPAIAKEGSSISWMTVEPIEMNTFQKIIDEASGHVLLFGCGLAYAPYMIARKPNVTSVTVVDYSQGVIDLCSKEIVSQFSKEVRDKISFEKADAVEYLKSCDLTSYNYVNVDVWYDTTDMIFTYLRCLPIAFSNPQTKFSYWLEDKLMIHIQYVLMAALCQYSSRTDNLSAGMELIQRIGRDLLAEAGNSWTEDSFRFFVNMNIRKLRELLFRWYTNNTPVFDRYYKKYEAEEKINDECERLMAGVIGKVRARAPIVPK